MRHRWGIIVLVAAVSFFTGGWLLQRGAASDGNVYQQARLFDDVLHHVHEYFVDSLGESELYQRATDGLLKRLEDPYSVLLRGEDYQRLTEQTTGNYGGLGIQIDVRNGWITVVAPLPDTPAEAAGIHSGDQIVEVDGVSTEGWTSDKAVSVLRGEQGSSVAIKIRRPGIAEPLPFDITRAVIHLRSVPPGMLLDDGIGYVALRAVSETSTDELRAEIDSLVSQGMKSVVLDLRSNPGGLLDQGVKVTDLFLDAGEEIVSTRGRTRGATRSYSGESPESWPTLPIVVLVDAASASAAEIIAGALQDHDRALVIGVPTWGKGLVQTLFRLDDATALKITTARWYTPSGRTIQRRARDPEDQMRLAQIAAAHDGVVPDSLRAEGDTAGTPEFRTAAGRIVHGGGGIVPDVIVTADTLSEEEQAFFSQLGANLPAYRDALTSIALELKNSGANLSNGFAVTPGMLAQVRERMTSRDVSVDLDVFQGAQEIIGQQLGYEIARYVIGRPA
ncbi:MAG: S41 family peptidase, partial [Gemmatimonadales bacterium]|nr:S41 family peptidase [Gemmatimonadales bacterium]